MVDNSGLIAPAPLLCVTFVGLMGEVARISWTRGRRGATLCCVSRRDQTLRLHTALATRVHRAPAGEDLVAIGGRLDRGHLLAGFVSGAFPMGLGPRGSGPIGWFSPDPRGVLRPSAVRESSSMRRERRGFHVTVDTAFAQVVAGCADPSRPGRWITTGYARAYRDLFDAGMAHSVEVWRDGALAGGLFGIAIGGLFAAESKFHHVTGASKAAVVALARLCDADGDPRRVIDVQWRTDHLATLGVTEVDRSTYLGILGEALAAPVPAAFAGGAHSVGTAADAATTSPGIAALIQVSA